MDAVAKLGQYLPGQIPALIKWMESIRKKTDTLTMSQWFNERYYIELTYAKPRHEGMEYPRNMRLWFTVDVSKGIILWNEEGNCGTRDWRYRRAVIAQFGDVFDFGGKMHWYRPERERKQQTA